jgi:tetratricopeptide (TPR) repeat protein
MDAESDRARREGRGLGASPRVGAFAAAIAAIAVGLLFSRPSQPASSSSDELVREARAYEQAHEDDRAIRRYTEAIALDPTCDSAYLGLGSLRARRGDWAEADRVYSVGLSHVPSMHEALRDRARVRWAMGRRAEAHEDLEKYADDTHDLDGFRELAGWYGQLGQAPAELALWRRVVELASGRGDVALAREGRTMVRALQLLVGPADPVTAPVAPEGTRRAIATIARAGR